VKSPSSDGLNGRAFACSPPSLSGTVTARVLEVTP
jgi:hypothetical protein